MARIENMIFGAGCEFYPPEAVQKHFPNGLTAPIEGGPHKLMAGQLTDDSEMMSLLLQQVLNGQDLADVTNHGDFAKTMKTAYRDWYYSRPVDCGSTVAAALQQTMSRRTYARCTRCCAVLFIQLWRVMAALKTWLLGMPS